MNKQSTWGQRPVHRLGLAVLFGVLLTAPLGCGDKDEDKPNDAPLSVAITQPTAKAYVRDSLAFSARVEGGTPSELTVELLKDGEPLTRLHQPYSYTWDTKSVPEGTYALSVRVRRGDTSVTSQPLEVVVDRTSPTVVSRHPVLSGLAEWDGAISFTVSEPLAPDSMDALSVELLQATSGMGWSGISVKVSLSADGRTVDIVPDALMRLPATLAVVMKPTMKDLAGNGLRTPTEGWSWEARTWRLLKTPVRAGRGAVTSEPSLVTDGQGRPVLSFVEVDNVPVGQAAAQETVVTRWTGGTWERFTSPGTSGQGWLAVGGEGRLFLGTLVGEGQFGVREWKEQAWSPVAPPLDTDRRFGASPRTRLAATSTGVPVLAWQSITLDPGMTTASIQSIENGAWRPLWSRYRDRTLALGVGSADTVWLVTSRLDVTTRTYVSRWNGATFEQVGTSLEEAAGTGSIAVAADVDVDSQGRPYVVWRNEHHVYLQHWNGARWETVASREAPGTLADGEAVSVVVSPSSRVYFAWAYRALAGRTDISIDLWDAVERTHTVAVGALPANAANGVTLALDRHGLPMVAYLAPPESGSHRASLQVRVNH